MFRAEIARQCLQQVNESQSVAMKVNSVIIMKKLSFLKNEHSEKEFYDQKMLMKVRVARHENDFSARKISYETVHSSSEEQKVEESSLVDDEEYS